MPASAAAGEAGRTEPSLYDRIWKHTEWYDNKDNPVIQNLKFTGRFQVDYAVIDHEDFNRLDIRRWRMGAKAKLFHHFTVHSEAELDPAEDPLYRRLTDTYIAWSRNESFEFRIGKHSAPFTLDGATSSRELLTIDRNNLANNLWFPQEYIPGVSVHGNPAPWGYHLGVYTSGSANDEFGSFDGGYFVVASAGYDFADVLEVKEAVLSLDAVFNEKDSDNSFTRSLGQIGSLNFRFATDQWGVRADVSGGRGHLGQSDLWGAVLMPFYNLTSKLQLVGRYTWLHSSGNDGVRFARYESFVNAGRGDQYHEFYGGLNYYLYGHKLKVQTGVQYVEMRDRAGNGGAYQGWGWTTGLRVSW